MYDIIEPWRDSNWYFEAGQSMGRKATYMRNGIYQINCILEDPNKQIPGDQRKSMKAEVASLRTALKRIEDAYHIRCADLKAHPKLLKSFQEGFFTS